MSGIPSPRSTLVIVHADESCLGNQNEEPSPGGSGAMIELSTADRIVRQDFFASSRATTNNRMALKGAIDVLSLLRDDEGEEMGAGAGAGEHPAILYQSDSQYLVKGITEWVHNWERRGWRRKGGEVQNLALWKVLLSLSRRGEVRWRWVRGHAGHVKNEYADHLAVSTAEHQADSHGLVTSEFPEWLARQQTSGKFSGYDANADFEQLARRYSTDS